MRRRPPPPTTAPPAPPDLGDMPVCATVPPRDLAAHHSRPLDRCDNCPAVTAYRAAIDHHGTAWATWADTLEHPDQTPTTPDAPWCWANN